MNRYQISVTVFSMSSPTTSPYTLTPRIHADTPQAALVLLRERLNSEMELGEIFAYNHPTLEDVTQL